MGRRRTPRMPGLNETHHTLAKIKRIGLRHRKSPPTGSESHSHPRWNPHRFNLTVRCSRCRARGRCHAAPKPTTRRRGRARRNRLVELTRPTLGGLQAYQADQGSGPRRTAIAAPSADGRYLRKASLPPTTAFPATPVASRPLSTASYVALSLPSAGESAANLIPPDLAPYSGRLAPLR